MIYSQVFHKILYFPSQKYVFENFNISENNISSVELAQVQVKWRRVPYFFFSFGATYKAFHSTQNVDKDNEWPVITKGPKGS